MEKAVIADEIRSRLDIVDVVGEYLSLKRVGRNYVALCPFHAEKTPSFTVSPDKQIFYCFGCGKGGDVIKFVMLMEDLSYFEAVRLLANRLGIDVDEKELVEGESKSFKLINLHAELRLLFSKFLKSEVGKKARDYLRDRGIDAYYWERFGLGFCPDDSVVADILIKKGFTKSDLLDSGLFGLRGDLIYPKFRNRITIPITDFAGRVIAFGGRVIDGTEEPKYLNSPETPIYSKGRYLFGWPIARESIKHRDRVILVEGYMDVISMHVAGFSETVASLGTSLTKQQAERLMMLTRNIYIMYDGDSAGLKASLRASRILYSLGIEPRIVRLPEGEDPDSLARKDPGLIESLIENALTPIDLILEEERLEEGIFSKKMVVERALELMEDTEDPIVVDSFIDYLSGKLDIPKTFLKLTLEGKKKSFTISKRKDGNRSTSGSPDRKVLWERALLKWCLDDRELLDMLSDRIVEVEYRDPLVSKILPSLVSTGNINELVVNLSENLQKELLSLIFSEDRILPIEEVLTIFDRKVKESRFKRLKAQIMSMDMMDERFNELFKLYVELKKELAKGGRA